LLTVAVVNRKGGVGKTTTALYLAAGMARRGPTLFVDADPMASGLTWADMAGESGTPLPFPVVGLPVPRLDHRLPSVAAPYGFVIVDSPPDRPEISGGAIRAADVVLVPLAPTLLDLTRLGPTGELVAQALAEMDRKPAVLVVLTRTRAGTRSRVAARFQLEADGWRVAAAEIPEREAIAQAAGMLPADLGAYEDLLAEVLSIAPGHSREIAS
jgi:chromosome partitioning protein